MNSLLQKHRPSDLTPEKWAAQWEALGVSLEPLAEVIQDLKSGLGEVTAKDFDCPNHYAKLAFEAGLKAAYENIYRLLPKSSKSS